jgi:hypothetical protein
LGWIGLDKSGKEQWYRRAIDQNELAAWFAIFPRTHGNQQTLAR